MCIANDKNVQNLGRHANKNCILSEFLKKEVMLLKWRHSGSFIVLGH